MPNLRLTRPQTDAQAEQDGQRWGV